MIYFAFVSLENNWRDLVMDIRLGRVNPDLNISEGVRVSLNSVGILWKSLVGQICGKDVHFWQKASNLVYKGFGVC